MHPLQVVAECTLAGEVTFCVIGLGVCTRTSVQPTSHAQLSYQLLGQLIREQLVMLQQARCIVEARHVAPCATLHK